MMEGRDMDNDTLIAAARKAVAIAGDGYVYNPEPGGYCQYQPDSGHPYGCIVNAIVDALPRRVRELYEIDLADNERPQEWQVIVDGEDVLTHRQIRAMNVAQLAQDGEYASDGFASKTWTRPPLPWAECLDELISDLEDETVTHG